MDGFAFDQHRDVFLDPGQPGLGLFGDVDAMQDRVAIGAIERFEKAFRRLVFRQRGAEIVRHLGRALRRIGGAPAAVLFGAFNPAGRMRFNATSSSARVRFFSDHLLAD
jgi:hypothetical protein